MVNLMSDLIWTYHAAKRAKERGLTIKPHIVNILPCSRMDLKHKQQGKPYKKAIITKSHRIIVTDDNVVLTVLDL